MTPIERERRFRIAIVWETPPEARAGLDRPYAVTGGSARYDVITRWPGDTIAALETEALATFRVRREDCSVLHVEELEPDPVNHPLSEQELHARGAHPEWEYETVTIARKSGASDRPYPPDRWEPNLHVTGDGRNWSRFEHTEDSYWMRRRV